MQTVHHTKLVIKPNRQRRTHDEAKHQELMYSIQGPSGLMQAPVVREEGGALVLVAGERRTKAMLEIWELGGTFTYNGETVPEGHIPYTNLGDLGELEAEEAELDENIKRDDLTWQDRVQAEARLLDLRGRMAAAAGVPAPPLAQVAKEIHPDLEVPATKLTNSVILSNNLHRPEVAKAKSTTEALKILNREVQAEQNAKVAAAMGKEFLGGKHQLHNADVVDWIVQEPAGTYDIILSDPPYGMGADEFGDSGGGTAGAHFYDDSYDSWEQLMTIVVPELFRVTKPDAHAYLFCDFDNFHVLKDWMVKAGWKVFRTPLIWFKPGAFRAPWPDKGPQRKYECILYAIKGDLKCTSLAGDVLTYSPDENLGHHAQKPVALYADLLKRSARPGMKVLDMFCGSGPVFDAAQGLSVVATGVERDAAAYGISVGRLERIKKAGV